MKDTLSDYQTLILLAQEKINSLLELLDDLQHYYDDLEKNSGDEILLMIDNQTKTLEKIKTIDQKQMSINVGFSKPANANNILDSHIDEQKDIIEKIIALNKKTVIKTEKVSLEIKDKIKSIRQKRDIINNYYTKNKQTGNLYDFMEGKKQ